MLTINYAGQQVVEKAFEELETLLEDAEKATQTVADRMRQIGELDERIGNVTSSQKRAEAETMKQITDEVGEDGKKVYTNAETRKAELAKRMDSHPSHSELAALVNEKFTTEQDIKDAERTLKNIARREAFYHARIAHGTAVLNAFKH